MAKKKANPPKKAAAPAPAPAPVPVTQGFTDVISRAMVDDAFRKSLQSDADRENALVGYTLSPRDREAIQASVPFLETGATQFQSTPGDAVLVVFCYHGTRKK